MSACVSPPQLRVSHIVEVAAIMAQAASTALPPRWNIIAPAVAASGLPVIAIHFCPCSGGFCVFATDFGMLGDTAWPSASGATLVMAASPRTSPEKNVIVRMLLAPASFRRRSHLLPARAGGAAERVRLRIPVFFDYVPAAREVRADELLAERPLL